MDNPWGEDSNIESAPSYTRDDRHERAWRALVEVITKYPAVQEIFIDVNFEKKVDLSILANAPAEVKDIFHELFGLINGHCVAQRQTLHTLQRTNEERNDEVQKLRSVYNKQKNEISLLKSQLSEVPIKEQKPPSVAPTVPQASVIQQHPAQSFPPSMIYLEKQPFIDPFSGDQKDVVKRHNDYTAWKLKLISKWNTSRGNFDSDFKKICDAINWLKGDAYTRLQSKIALFFSSTNDPSGWPWSTSAELFRELDKKYLTADIRSIARGNLNDLRMTGKWKDFPSFISEFERLADQGELSSSMQVYHLRHKVSVVIGL